MICRTWLMLTHSAQGRKPGTDKWIPIGEDEDEEEVPGVLIVRLRENLDFGKFFVFKSVDARF